MANRIPNIVSLAAGLLLGAATITVAATSGEPDSPDSFRVNDHGQTYGSALGANTEPDLVEAIGDGGVQGYVESDDLLPQYTPRSPDEAIAFMKTDRSGLEVKIPLYASDGTTVLGTFTIGPPVGAVESTADAEVR